jgi:hypothetical protein
VFSVGAAVIQEGAQDQNKIAKIGVSADIKPNMIQVFWVFVTFKVR